ncbi:MAG: hypothetical protein ABF727_11255 [Gluconobacter oxydans]
MSQSITSGVTPAMISGIRKAIEVCEQYAEENGRIARDDIEYRCLEPKNIGTDDLASAFQHGDKMKAGHDIACLLRAMLSEGRAA